MSRPWPICNVGYREAVLKRAAPWRLTLHGAWRLHRISRIVRLRPHGRTRFHGE